jgi:hypothetical protein
MQPARLLAAFCGHTPRRKIAGGSGQSLRVVPKSTHDRGYSASREDAMSDFKTRWLMNPTGALEPR